MSTIAPDSMRSSKPPIIPRPFEANQPQTIRLYPLSNYTFGVKETQPEEDPSVVARLNRLQEHYSKHGMRRTCEGILVCHEHNHPHILMLQIANAFFKLPGDYLQPEHDEVEGFKTRLDERLAPVGSLSDGQNPGDWNIGDCLAQWWRPNFETFMYPFVPAHVTRPKECKKLYFIQLPETSKHIRPPPPGPGLFADPDAPHRGPERPQEHEAAGRPPLRALRQHRPLRTSALRHTTPAQPLQLRVRRRER